MLQLLLPGTNSIYYGDEIGMLDLPTEKLVSKVPLYFLQNISKPKEGICLFVGADPKRCYAMG